MVVLIEDRRPVESEPLCIAYIPDFGANRRPAQRNEESSLPIPAEASGEP
jgi:hypothetical protein